MTNKIHKYNLSKIAFVIPFILFWVTLGLFGQLWDFVQQKLLDIAIVNDTGSSFTGTNSNIYNNLVYAFVEIPLCYILLRINRRFFLFFIHIIMSVLFLSALWIEECEFLVVLEVFTAIYSASLFILVCHYYMNLSAKYFILLLSINFFIGVLGAGGGFFTVNLLFSQLSFEQYIYVSALILSVSGFFWLFLSGSSYFEALDKPRYITYTSLTRLVKDSYTKLLFGIAILFGVFSSYFYDFQTKYMLTNNVVENDASSWCKTLSIAFGAILGSFILSILHNKWRSQKTIIWYIIGVSIICLINIACITLPFLGFSSDSKIELTLVMNFCLSMFTMMPFIWGYHYKREVMVIWFCYYSLFAFIGSSIAVFFVNQGYQQFVYDEITLTVCLIVILGIGLIMNLVNNREGKSDMSKS